MWDKILDLLKIVFDKYLIPAIIAVPTTIFLYVIVPDNNFIQAKVGISVFVVFIYASIFLLILFAIWVKGYIKSVKDRRKQIAENEKQLKEQQEDIENLKRNKEKEMLEELWDRVDALGNDERMLIDGLLKNGNKPIGMYMTHNKYQLDYFVNSTPMKNGDKCKVLMRGYFNDISMQYESYESDYDGYYKYKLKDNIYLRLKESKEKYGKISHFS